MLPGVTSVKAHPPPPAPVSLECRPHLDVTQHSSSSELWLTPNVTSNCWFRSISFCVLYKQMPSNAVCENTAEHVHPLHAWNSLFRYALALLQSDWENRERLKYLRNVYCVTTYHSKDQDMRTTLKTTILLTSLLAVQFSHEGLAFFLPQNNIPEIFLVLTVFPVSL